ncbi:MAG: hypothetical protein H6714_06990 [Myxococcales bacterium]|nr:hypothetical protein [Myxococcales bacterium]
MPSSHKCNMVLVMVLAALCSCRFTSSDDPKDGPCGKRCEGELPYCHLTLKTCVACLQSAHCADDREAPYCDEPLGQCVACLKNTECTNNEAPVCDPDHTCQPCTDDGQCAHLGLGICEDGTCVACTIQTEATACGLNACDPATHTCTSTPRGTVQTCSPCKADSECAETLLCVPMQFSPEGGPVTQLGGHCLSEKPTDDGCENPYSSALARTTLSGVTGKIFCGVAEPLTTCRAVLDLTGGTGPKACSTDSDCGVSDLDDGICNTPNVGGCTYACNAGAHCPDGFACPAGGGYCGKL